MSKHETVETAVLSGVALLFVVAILFIAAAIEPADTSAARERAAIVPAVPATVILLGEGTTP